MMAAKCLGCGAILQSLDNKSPGYLPTKLLAQDGNQSLICQRCYRIKHYAKLEEVNCTSQDYWQLVGEGIKQGQAVIKVVDIIDFLGSWNERLVELIGNKPWILAVNKVDLLPEQIKMSQVYQWVFDTLKEKNTKLPSQVLLISNEKRFGVTKLKNELKKILGNGKKATVVGCTNVGKSSLLNQLAGKKELTISKFPGTTLNLAPVFLSDEKIHLLDTPGIIPPGRVSDLLCPQCNLALIPAQEISRKTYKLENNQALMLGGIASFRIIGEEIRPIILAFAAQGVKFHRTRGERIEEIRKEHSGDWLLPPCSNCASQFASDSWDKFEVNLNEGEDLAIAGLGWISVRRGPVLLEMEIPSKVKWEVRKALISPGEKNG